MAKSSKKGKSASVSKAAQSVKFQAMTPAKVLLYPSMETATFTVEPQFTAALKDPVRLKSMVNVPVRLFAEATKVTDGRNARLVLGVVRDSSGATRQGIDAILLDSSDELVDRSTTDEAGLLILRFPRTADEGKLVGTIIVGGTQRVPIQIPSGRQHIVQDIVLPSLMESTATGVNYSVLERLPLDFTLELCDDITRLRGIVKDPILSGVAQSGDFRSRRLPLVKRFAVPYIGPAPDYRHFLVRVRQQWTFVGYTLGEIDEVVSLDPGAIIEESVETFRRTMRRTRRSWSQETMEQEREVHRILRQLSSIDRVISISQSSGVQEESDGYAGIGTKIGSAVGGAAGSYFGGIGSTIGSAVGGLFGGIIGGIFGDDDGGSSAFNRTTHSTTDTTLRVNSYLHIASSRVNTQVRSAVSELRDSYVRREREVDQVSPLLSRVTNLLRWTLYERYVVCTRVEDVVEIKRHPIAVSRFGNKPYFAPEDIVEYRRFFQPALLEPILAPHFATLRRAIAIERAGGEPVSVVHLTVDYTVVEGHGECRIEIFGRDVTLNLPPGGTRARGMITFPSPVPPAALRTADIELMGIPESVPYGLVTRKLLNIKISRVRFWFAAADEFDPDEDYNPGNRLHVTVDSLANPPINEPTKSITTPISVSPRYIDTTKNPLFIHVNRNATYYFGVILRAAYRIPSLRADVPQLQHFGHNHDIWKLPIVRFEGTDAFVMVEAKETKDKDDPVKKIKADKGAGTIIQIAAPGAYSEALQGLLVLDDAAGRIHPALEPRPPTVVTPLPVTQIGSEEEPSVD